MGNPSLQTNRAKPKKGLVENGCLFVAECGRALLQPAEKLENCSKMGFWGHFPNFRLNLSYFPGEAEIRIFLIFFAYFGPEARNPRSSRRAGS